nr:radical SAM/SPASM domain-containing protein [uncultured Agathobaculum sp.]
MKQYTKLKEDRHVLRDVIPLSKPYTLLIEPSNYCNFRCVSCFQSLHHSNYITDHRHLMDLSCFREIIHQMQTWEGEKLKVLKLSLYGEPFTNPNFCEMLHIAKQAEIAERIETTTNASLITPAIAERLVKEGIDYIRVSIYGGNQARYREVTGVDCADIEQIYKNLESIQQWKKYLGKDRPFLSVKMLDTFSAENDEFKARFSPVADELYLDQPHNWIATEEKNFIDSLYTSEEKRNQLKQRQQASYCARKSCPMPFTTLAVRADGMVSPCCVDWKGATNLESIHQHTLQEIWNGTAMYSFQKMQLEGRNQENSSCKNCEFYKSSYYMLDDIDGLPVDQLRSPV